MLSNRNNFITELGKVLKENPQMRGIIEKNSGSRLFDGLPEEFDAVFADSDSDASQLGAMLKKIYSRNTEMTDKGPIFTKEADKAIIKKWAKTIMARVCRELLDDHNKINPDFLTLIGKTPQTLSSRDLVCAYFSIANQYMIKKMIASEEARSIMVDVFDAFMTYINQYPGWVEEVLRDRMLPVKPSYLDETSNIPVADANFDLHLGIGAALFGLFALGGFAAYEAYQSRQNRSNDDEPDRPGYPDWRH